MSLPDDSNRPSWKSTLPINPSKSAKTGSSVGCATVGPIGIPDLVSLSITCAALAVPSLTTEAGSVVVADFGDEEPLAEQPSKSAPASSPTSQRRTAKP